MQLANARDVEAAATPPRAGFYQRIQAWMLTQRSPVYDALVATRKLALLSPLEGTIVEIGPGAGPNLPFYRHGVRWIGVEPNPYSHARLRTEAERFGLDAEIRLGTAEQLPFPDGAADAVVATLVLCSVRDQAAALREVRRVLRPGGRFVFMEHVVAPARTGRRLAQRLVSPLWPLVAGGCHPDRDTARAIREAGFARVDLRPFDLPIPVVGSHLAGIAWA